MSTRTELDHERPCLACGEPWDWVLTPTPPEAELPNQETWQVISGNCSARCVETGRVSVEEFNAALAERHRRGW
jgi:hypothetical protein